MVGGANVLQLVTSQGKRAVKQVSPIKAQGEKVSGLLPVQQFVVCGPGSLGANHSALGTAGKLVVVPQRMIKVEGEGEGTILKGSIPQNLLEVIGGVPVTSSSGSSGGSQSVTKLLLAPKKREQQQQQQQEEECSTYWEDYLE